MPEPGNLLEVRELTGRCSAAQPVVTLLTNQPVAVADVQAATSSMRPNRLSVEALESGLALRGRL